MSDTLGGRLEETMSQWYAMINFDATETIMEQSDYNRVAKIYGDEQISLAADEYAVSCSMDIWKEIRTEALAMQTQIEVNGRKLKPAVQQCLDGQLEMNGMVINLGIIIVPDGVGCARIRSPRTGCSPTIGPLTRKAAARSKRACRKPARAVRRR